MKKPSKFVLIRVIILLKRSLPWMDYCILLLLMKLHVEPGDFWVLLLKASEVPGLSWMLLL